MTSFLDLAIQKQGNDSKNFSFKNKTRIFIFKIHVLHDHKTYINHKR